MRMGGCCTFSMNRRSPRRHAQALAGEGAGGPYLSCLLLREALGRHALQRHVIRFA
jgi:hypothetical protein